MDLSARHPLYTDMRPDWCYITDCYKGERVIKRKTTEYLPYTSAMIADGIGINQPGLLRYNAYRERAHFPELVREAVEAIIGLMHRKPATVKVPTGMLPILDKCTLNGESVQVLLRAINQGQLLYGRIGLLADIATGAPANALPHLVTYSAETIVNWDVSPGPEGRDELSFILLDESENVLTDKFAWEHKEKYRVLLSGPHARAIGLGGEYASTLQEAGRNVVAENFTIPSLGGRTLPTIPFTIIGSNDLVPEPDTPPLLRVARLSVLIYRGEADYRQALFMQGQDTLVIIGGHTQDEDQERVGSGALIEVPLGGDAKYVGVTGEGLGEQRQALEADYKRAAAAGAELLEARGKAAESGDALRVRVAARTASLATVAKAGAEGLQNALRQVAAWRGFDPNEVIVEPNLDFAENEFNAQDLTYFMEAKQAGFPISLKSAHEWVRRNDITQLDFEDEIEQIKKENEDGTAEALRAPPSRMEEEQLDETKRAAKAAEKNAASAAKAAAKKPTAAPSGGGGGSGGGK